jgi:hypothetical protein
MTPTLRPMNLGEILDRTLQIYRSRFLVFVGIEIASPMATLAVLILGEVGSLTTLSVPTKEMFRQAASWMPNDWPASLTYFLGWPLIAYLTSRELLGESATLGTAIGFCRDRLKSWLAISAILWAVCSLLPSSIYRLLWESGAESWVGLHWDFAPLSSTGAFLFALLKWCAGSLCVLGVALGAPAWAVEEIGAVASVRRGWTLGKGSWFRILTAEFLSDTLRWILVGSLALAFVTVLGFFLRNPGGGESIYQLRYKFELVAVRAVSILIGAILPIAFTVIYYDQRIRKEGFDIERMMDAAGLNATEPLAAAIGAMPNADATEGQA